MPSASASARCDTILASDQGKGRRRGQRARHLTADRVAAGAQAIGDAPPLLHLSRGERRCGRGDQQDDGGQKRRLGLDQARVCRRSALRLAAADCGRAAPSRRERKSIPQQVISPGAPFHKFRMRRSPRGTKNVPHPQLVEGPTAPLSGAGAPSSLSRRTRVVSRDPSSARRQRAASPGTHG